MWTAVGTFQEPQGVVKLSPCSCCISSVLSMTMPVRGVPMEVHGSAVDSRNSGNARYYDLEEQASP